MYGDDAGNPYYTTKLSDIELLVDWDKLCHVCSHIKCPVCIIKKIYSTLNSTCVSGYSACVGGKNSRKIAAHLEAALPLTKHGSLSSPTE
jgi:hypothetical protein